MAPKESQALLFAFLFLLHNSCNEPWQEAMKRISVARSSRRNSHTVTCLVLSLSLSLLPTQMNLRSACEGFRKLNLAVYHSPLFLRQIQERKNNLRFNQPTTCSCCFCCSVWELWTGTMARVYNTGLFYWLDVCLGPVFLIFLLLFMLCPFSSMLASWIASALGLLSLNNIEQVLGIVQKRQQGVALPRRLLCFLCGGVPLW